MSNGFNNGQDVLRSMVYFLAGSQDPSVVPTLGAKGSLFLRVGENGGLVYQKQDNGQTTNWSVNGTFSGSVVQDNGVTVGTNVTTLNFVGATVIQTSPGVVEITFATPTGVLLDDGSVPMLANFDFGGFKGVNLLDPTLAQDAATKNYVDTEIAAIPVGANTFLSNLTAPTSFNQNLLPDVNGNRNLGSDSLNLNEVHSRRLVIHQNGTQQAMLLGGDITSPSGVTVRSGIQSLTQSLLLCSLNITSGAANSQTIRIESGNVVDGTSGNISLRPGTVSGIGTRGSIDFTNARGINAQDPINPQDVATKNYVDSVAGAPSGAPNTVAFFDSLGALNSNGLLFTYDNAQGVMVLANLSTIVGINSFVVGSNQNANNLQNSLMVGQVSTFTGTANSSIISGTAHNLLPLGTLDSSLLVGSVIAMNNTQNFSNVGVIGGFITFGAGLVLESFITGSSHSLVTSTGQINASVVLGNGHNLADQGTVFNSVILGASLTLANNGQSVNNSIVGGGAHTLDGNTERSIVMGFGNIMTGITESSIISGSSNNIDVGSSISRSLMMGVGNIFRQVDDSVILGSNNSNTGTILRSVIVGQNNVGTGGINNSFVSAEGSFAGIIENSLISGTFSANAGITNSIAIARDLLANIQILDNSLFMGSEHNLSSIISSSLICGIGHSKGSPIQSSLYAGSFSDLTDPLRTFVIGIGTFDADRRNALAASSDGLIERTQGGLRVRTRDDGTPSVAIDPRTDYFVACSNGGLVDAFLPPGEEGMEYKIKGKNGSTVTLVAAPGQTVDGVASLPLAAGEGVTIVFSGTEWSVL